MRGGRLARAAAVVGGRGASALAADEMPPGRAPLPAPAAASATAHHVLAELGPPDAERTVVLMAHHDAAHSAFFFNPAITEAIAERAPRGVRGQRHQPAADVAGGRRACARRGRCRPRQSRSDRPRDRGLRRDASRFMADIASRDVVPGANDNGTGCVALVALARALAGRPHRVASGSCSSPPPRRRSARGWGCSWSATATSCPATAPSSSASTRSGRRTLTVLRGEGMLAMRDYPPRSLELIDSERRAAGHRAGPEPAAAQRHRRRLPPQRRL